MKARGGARSRRGGRAALVSLLVLASIDRAAADTVPPELARQLRLIESAFRDGSGRSLRSSLAPGRVRADLDPLADGHGSYGPGQLQVLFDRTFDAFETRSFQFRDRDVTVPSSRTAFARVRWERVSRQDRRSVAETLTFTLRADDGVWRILEIRTSR